MPRLREIAIQFGSPTKTNLSGDHFREADVLMEREPLGRIGAREARNFIWLLVEIPDAVEPMGPQLDAQDVLVEKARFVVPITALQDALPTFDVSRARDPDDVYQPFIPVTETPEGDFLFGTPTLTVSLSGRLYDKQLETTR